ISGSYKKRTVRVTVLFTDALNEKHNNKSVNDSLKKLLQCLSEPIVIESVGKDFSYKDDFATGKEANSYVLCIHPDLRDFSPICCGHCRRNIPYYLLPPLSDEAVRELTSWQTSYAAYDQLFYATGIGEISAHKMLSNMSSRLNQKGLFVCRLLEKELGKPVYYYLYRFYGKQPSRCPICRSNWQLSEDSLFDYQCDKCRIVADRTTYAEK
ncbi:MAG: DUF2310 family Zn-ribbon-containing protein, partial [Clostridia bacterium]|nr:DUF2310 family Zn-ribbon-containing protein [Clostridia bacterium]